jgi:hypothetical protein
MIAVFSIFSFPAPSVMAGPCSFDFVKKIFSRKKTIEVDEFKEYKKFFIKAIQNGDTIQPYQLSTPEQKLAFLEAVNSKIPANPLNLEAFLKSASPAQEKLLKKILTRFEFKKGMHGTRAANAMNDLYRLIHQDPRRIRRYLKSYLPELPEQIIQKRIETAILNENIVDAFKELGFLKDKNALERFRLWRGKHENAENLVISSALNYANHIVVPGVVIPPSKLKFFKPTPELISRVREKGFSVVKEEFFSMGKSQGINSAVLDSMYDYAKRIYYRGMSAYGMYFVYQNWEMMKNMAGMAMFAIRSMFITPEDLQQLQDENFSLSGAQNEQLRSSILGQAAFETVTPEYVWTQAEVILNQNKSEIAVNFTGNPEDQPKDISGMKPASPQKIYETAHAILVDLVNENEVSSALLVDFEKKYSSKRP